MSGPLTGLGPLLSRENRKWWRGRRWIIQAVCWTVLAIGAYLVAKTAFSAIDSVPQDGPPVNAGDFFAQISPLTVALPLLTTLMPIVVLVLILDSLLSERESGVTAWLLTKPAARPAYLAAKVIADAGGILGAMIGIPFVIFFIALMIGRDVPPFLGALLFLAIQLIFWHALGMLIGTVLGSRVLAILIAIGIALFGGQVVNLIAGRLPRSAGDVLVQAVPWGAGDAASTIAAGEARPEVVIALAVTIGWTLAAYALAWWRIQRIEL